MDMYPGDPRLDYVAWCRSQSPEERRQWLDAFKQFAPDNALAHYLSARDHFTSRQNDQAVQELLAAATKPIQDYSLDFVQNSEEAYRAAGYSDAEAKMMATSTLLLPQLAEYQNEWIETWWYLFSSGTGVSPVCRLHDSHGRDARATTLEASDQRQRNKRCCVSRNPVV